MSFSAPRVTLIVDRRLYRVGTDDAAPLSLVEAAIEGGIDMVQLRLTEGDDVQTNVSDDLGANAVAQRVREMTKDKVAFLVTGDIELADRSRSDGVVLVGDKTYRPDDAREYLHGTAIIGCYVDTIRSATIAEHGGADFVQVGPIFNGGDDNALSMIRKIKDALNIPVIAHGGIDTPERAKSVIESGADGIAVSTSILDAPDPKSAAQALKDAVV